MSAGFDRKLESAKRNILYNFNAKIEELKSLYKIRNDFELQEALQERELLPPLPLTNIEDFLSLEQELNDKAEVFATLVSIVHSTYHFYLFLCLKK